MIQCPHCFRTFRSDEQPDYDPVAAAADHADARSADQCPTNALTPPTHSADAADLPTNHLARRPAPNSHHDSHDPDAAHDSKPA